MAGLAVNQKSATPASAGKQRWMHRHPRKFLLLVNLIGMLVLLAISEVALRSWGFHPGYLEMGWMDFQPLERGAKLEVRYDFYTDSLGIFKASNKPDVHGPGYFVNSMGFRGPEFEPQDSSRKKVMLIGDSFTWGATARPIDSAYADRIRRPDWQVMNFGIPGADPDQYERIAEIYIPQMKPDVVCLFFYMANDVMHLPQHVGPFQNRYHLTNVGWLNPFIDGVYIGDAQATYDYCAERLTIPPTNLLNRLCALTCVGTLAWRALLRLHVVGEHHAAPLQAAIDAAQKLRVLGPYANPHLQKVQALCTAHNIPFRLYLIPTHNDIHAPTAKENETLFQGLEVQYCDQFLLEDYNERPDGHFNNQGHRKMSQYVSAQLEKILGK
jgi:hypothetical protein